MILAVLCYIRDTKTGKTLMMHRTKKRNDHHKGKWNGIGGKFEPGETPEECVLREVKEETGLDLESPELRGFITFPLFDGISDWYVFVFTADKYSGEIRESDEGVLEWVENRKLKELNLWEGDKIFLDWLDDEKFFSAKFVYENKNFIDYSVEFYNKA